MGAKIKEIFEKLTQKEKIIIIASASALALVLITVALLLAFCGTGDGNASGSVDHNTHSYKYELIKADGKFNVVAKCNLAGCKDPGFVVPDVKAEIKSYVDATTEKEGSIVYSYEYEGRELLYIEKIDPIPYHEHKLNGKTEKEFLGDNRVVSYDYPGIKIANNVSYVCEGTVGGFYKCDECEELVQVQVYRPHVGILAVTLNPGCDTPGKESTVCDLCEILLEEGGEIPALGHSYEYSIVGASTVVGTCTRKGCTNPESREENVKSLTLVDKIPSKNCATPGQEIYTYVNSKGETVKISVSDKKVKNHTLNGKDATTFMDADGNYSFDVKGITTASPVTCGSSVLGLYICEVCEEPVRVTVTKPAHNMKLTGTVNPTKTADGYTFLKCHNVGCDEPAMKIILPKIEIGKNATVIVEADVGVEEVVRYRTSDNAFNLLIELEITISSKHDHVYSYTIEDNGGQINVIGTCTVNKCADPNKTWEGVTGLKETHRHPATCQNGEKVEYTCKTKIGETLDFFVYVGEKLDGHCINGAVATPDTVVQIEVGGVIENVPAFTYTGGKDGIKVFNTDFQPGDLVSGYYICEHCEQPVQIKVYIPEDYVNN